MAYQLEGRILEVCDCNVLCQCWIGENPDNGTCDAVVAYHIDSGTVDEVDGLSTRRAHTGGLRLQRSLSVLDRRESRQRYLRRGGGIPYRFWNGRRGRWLINSKGAYWRFATATFSVSAGSARIPTTVPATRWWHTI